MRSSEEYLECLRSMKQNVRMGGEIVKRDDSRIIPGVNVMRITYDMASDPDNSELFTTTSQYTGEKIKMTNSPSFDTRCPAA